MADTPSINPFAEGVNDDALDPHWMDNVDDERHLSPEEAQACRSFDPVLVENEFMWKVFQSKQHFRWKTCHQAALWAQQTLYEMLKPYKPRFTIVFGYGENINQCTEYNYFASGVAMMDSCFASDHAWLQTQVCGENFVTDLTQPTPQASLLGFHSMFFYADNHPNIFALKAYRPEYHLRTYESEDRMTVNDPFLRQVETEALRDYVRLTDWQTELNSPFRKVKRAVTEGWTQVGRDALRLFKKPPTGGTPHASKGKHQSPGIQIEEPRGQDYSAQRP